MQKNALVNLLDSSRYFSASILLVLEILLLIMKASRIVRKNSQNKKIERKKLKNPSIDLKENHFQLAKIPIKLGQND